MISIRFAVVVTVVGTCLAVGAGRAVAEDALAAGTLIRIHAEEADAGAAHEGGRKWVGYVVEDDGESIVLRLRNRQKTIRLQRAELRSFAIAHPEKATRWRGAGRGFVTGAVVGALAGALLTAIDNGDRPRCSPDEWCLDLDFHPLVGAVGGAIYAAPVGALVGAVAPGSQTVWKPVSVGSPLALAPSVEGLRPRGAHGVAVRLRF